MLLRRIASTLILGIALAPGAQAAPFWGTYTDVSVVDVFSNGGQNNPSGDRDGVFDPGTGLPDGGAALSHSLVDDAVSLDSRGTGPWNRGVAEVGASVAGLFVHLMPVFGIVLAWLVLGERLLPYHVAGIALILAGIWLTSRQGRRGDVQEAAAVGTD